MAKSEANLACCIVGAGYSHVAGLPLTSNLFSTDVAVTSKRAAARFDAVWEDYDKWQAENPSRNPEEYLADLYHNFFARPAPPFSWAVELITAVLATPRATDVRMINPRYGARVITPSYCSMHNNLWRSIIGLFDGISVLTTNYDLLVERSLRHRPMKRVFGPGCYYGGIPRPQVLKGNALPFTVHTPERWVELRGTVPIYKLHGSLNWTRTDTGIELSQDLRAAFRQYGNAAIVPPLPEKQVPAWLRPVWIEAETELARAKFWVVCGYSLPSYDTAIEEIFRRSSEGEVEHIILMDPFSKELRNRYSSTAPSTVVHCLPGLPEGARELHNRVKDILCA